MELQAIVYTSVATHPMGLAELDRLLTSARNANAREHVTGALLHDGTHFFQYLEGPDQALARVYARICQATSHRDLTVLHRGPVAKRVFGDWHMASCIAPQSVLQRLATARWDSAVQSLSDTQLDSPGLALLLEHWQQHGPSPR